MDTTTLAFLILAAIALIAAYRVVTTPNIMHAAIWLGGTFVAIAGIFLVLNAEFLAAAQVLIYVGAITTIIIFGLMLSENTELRTSRQRASEEGEPAAGQAGRDPSAEIEPPPALSVGSRLRQFVLPVVGAVAFAGVMLWVYTRAELPASPPAEAIEDTTRAIGLEMFTRFIIPFELAAILLLVALVGAIVIATRFRTEEQEEEEEH